MARSQNKLSVRQAQPAYRSSTSRKPKPQKQYNIAQVSQVKGKTLEAIEFISAPEYKGVSLSFRDKTFLDLKIETAFTVKADYLDQKTGKHRVLKMWPPHIYLPRSRQR